MAASQVIFSWIVLLSSTSVTKGCHPFSKELHICLNIYLERDFPLIETILKGQRQPGYGGGRVLLEGPDLQSICRQIGLLRDCYKDLQIECDTYWQLERYQRLMNTLNDTHSHLCGNFNNSTNNIRDILLSTTCISGASDYLSECEEHEIQWFQTWKKILRLQVSAQETCSSLIAYRKCFLQKLNNFSCGKQSSGTYRSVLKVWISSWCSRAPSLETAVAVSNQCNMQSSTTLHVALILSLLVVILSHYR